MIIKKKDIEVTTVENLAGGKGQVTLHDLVPTAFLKDEAKLFKRISVGVGASIGTHDHTGNYEVYYILSGQGIVDDNGREVAVSAGDVVYTTDGATHSLTNTGDEPCEMIAVIIYENK